MSIKTKKLTIAEICSLNVELNSEKGLLSERLPMVFKYHLTKLALLAADEQKAVDAVRNETIMTQGFKNSLGGFSIDQFIDSTKGKKKERVLNPVYTSFVKDMESLYAQEKEIEYEEFFIQDLKNVESGGSFPVFFKLLD